MSILLLSDSYKATHWRQYPPGTESIYSYFESRGTSNDWPTQDAEIVFFGLQYLLGRYLEATLVTEPEVVRAQSIWRRHFGQELFNLDGWLHIVREHGGRLPVEIKAVPEGTVVPARNVLMTIENTDPACYWLPNFLETLLVQVWYPCTVATLSREIKKVLREFLLRTGDLDGIQFKLHDFGFRGVSSVESAGIGGAAHLVNFAGTDTIQACVMLQRYYHADMAGHSIPAAEHSTITSWGPSGELDAYLNMLEQYPEGLVSVVSDSWDVYKACLSIWGGALRDRVLARNGTVVVRPDSGDPPSTVVRVLNTLEKAFGSKRNAKGFKELPPQVRIIQGDGVDYTTLRHVLFQMEMNGWSANNIAFGMGGALLQKLNRDHLGFAFKCSSMRLNGYEADVWKDPVTDPGKRSKRGRLKLVRTQEGWRTEGPLASTEPDQLVTVFRNGEVTRTWGLQEIRERAAV